MAAKLKVTQVKSEISHVARDPRDGASARPARRRPVERHHRQSGDARHKSARSASS